MIETEKTNEKKQFKRQLPAGLIEKIYAHRRTLSHKEKRDISLDEATESLLLSGLESSNQLKQN